MLIVLLACAFLQSSATGSIQSRWCDIPADWPADIRKSLAEYGTVVDQSRNDHLFGLEYKLKALEKSKTRSPAERMHKATTVRDLKARIKLAEHGVTIPTPSLMDQERKPGVVGNGLGGFRPGTVKQVTSEAVFVAVAKVRYGKLELGSGGLVATPTFEGEETVAILGLDTSKIVDDDAFDSDIVLRCVGAKSYTTVTGATRTLWTYERFTEFEYVRQWEALRIHAFAEWPGK